MADDLRPDVAVGHIHLDVNDVAVEYEFFRQHGMREILKRNDFAILELRGGTHLVIRTTEEALEPGARAPFDLMVDDIDGAFDGFNTAGCDLTPIERGSIHDSFTVITPNGYILPINSSHVAGPV
ncbi:MAG: VOC family protein [Gammaproteobacteria bacterium]|nr:VOC family protein [Gammaproteobacteria bacterium]